MSFSISKVFPLLETLEVVYKLHAIETCSTFSSSPNALLLCLRNHQQGEDLTHTLTDFCLACWSPKWPSLFLRLRYHSLLGLCDAVKTYWPTSALPLASQSTFATALGTDSMNWGKNGCKAAFWGCNSMGLLRLQSPMELTGWIGRTLHSSLLAVSWFGYPFFQEVGEIVKPAGLRHAQTGFLSVFHNL